MEATLVAPEPAGAEPTAYITRAVGSEHEQSGTRAGIVDLFAGLGCVARGFTARQPFETLALIDVDEAARETYLHNFPGAPYRLADVAELSEHDLSEIRDGRPIAGVVGCPPCQGFSAAGRRRADDERNRLLAAFFAAVDLAEPMFFVMENVPAALYRPELARALEGLADRFVTCSGILNAACYGLPQTRQRAIVIGYRRDLDVNPTLPPPTHFGRRPVFSYARGTETTPTVEGVAEILGESPHIGVERARRRGVVELLPKEPGELLDLVQLEEAVGDLPVLAERAEREPTNRSAYSAALAGDVAESPNHEPWSHTRATVRKLAAVPEGGRLQTTRRYYSQAYARLHRRGLARTVTTNFHNAGCGRFTHWAEARTLSVREAARLQGIPDSFELIGHRSTQERLVGNAFPLPWAEAIAAHISGQLAPVFGFRPAAR